MFRGASGRSVVFAEDAAVIVLMMIFGASDGAAEEFVPETPNLFNNPRSVMPGSIVRFTGWGMSPRTRVKLGDRLLPVTELDATHIAVQFPWDATPGSTASLTIGAGGIGSPFVPPVNIAVQSIPTVDLAARSADLMHMAVPGRQIQFRMRALLMPLRAQMKVQLPGEMEDSPIIHHCMALQVRITLTVGPVSAIHRLPG